MKTTLLKMRGLLLASIFIFSTFSNAIPQTAPGMLEDILSSVITVGVHQTDYANRALGFRGSNISEVAYEKALDLAGVVSSGSGFVILKNGKKYVVTNAHVIENASTEDGSIYVYSINRTPYEVKVLGGDSFYDIAVLEFVDAPGAEITTVQFKQEEPRLGETVYAIGNPLGEYPYSVSDGIISAKNRVRGSYTGKFGFLQTTATVIWGNSGGPLVDEKGNVAGINSQIAFASTPDGGQVWQSQINFALEAEISERLVNDIIENDGRVLRAYFGMEIGQNYEYDSDWFGNWYLVGADAVPKLTAVLDDAPSYSALSGFVGADIIKVNGEEVRNVEEVLGELESVKPGSTISVTFDKYGSQSTVKVNSKLLTSTELESIAVHVLEGNAEVEPNFNDIMLSLTALSTENLYTFDGYDYLDAEEDMVDKKYYVVAAGVAGYDLSSMWIIEELKDFGAAMKLSGLSGMIDIYALDPNTNGDELQMFRQYLSGDGSIVMTTLWY